MAIVADVADGLAAAHAKGVVHRDVKPENILLDMQGPLGPGGSHPALLTDFGVAKLIDSPRRTRATKIIGTPDYLAPEIVEGLPPRASVDIYALATVLYELLAGFTPFGGGHPGAVLRRHVTETVVPLPGIPDELWQLIVQCLAKAPASRLRASELGVRLRELLPLLAGMPPLDVDEPDAEEEEEPDREAPTAASDGDAASSGRPVRRGAVPLVPGAKPADSNRDTHTSMRVPAPDELAGARGGPPGCLGPPARPVRVRPGIGRPRGGVGWPWGPRPWCWWPRRGSGCGRPRRGTTRGRHRRTRRTRRPPRHEGAGAAAPGDGGGRARSVATAVRLEGVAVVDVSEELKSLSSTMESIEAVLDLDKLRADIAVLEEQAAAPSLWDNPDEAQKITSKLSHLQAEVRKADALRSRIDDLSVLFEMAEEEDDPDTLAEAEAELTSVKKALDEMEVRTLLSGEYDSREALVNIRAEAGGVDAADFAEKLQRMYLRWAEQHGYKTEIYETSYAEEAGIKSTTFAVQIPYAYGTLSVEQGTHRLVRISPFDNQGRRQTSFAGVEILPVVEQTDHIEIDESELRVDVYRSSGPGGQGVNTTDSAVRLTHLPTGIVVSCQNERSQIQNKASAMNVLQAKLLERRRQEEQAAMDALKGDGGNSWGNQMRSYVLHPYQMVKDLRTEFEVGNPEAVFNGEIDGFLEAGIRWRKQQEK